MGIEMEMEMEMEMGIEMTIDDRRDGVDGGWLE